MKKIVKNPADRRSDILQAARKLFLLKDYDKTTMQDVMDNLGIAKGTIYHYFDSKEDLLQAVVIDMVEKILEEIQDRLKKINGNALEKIRQLIVMSNIAEKNPELLEQLHRPTNSTLHLRILTETLLKFTPIYEELIQQGCNEGLFQTEHPKECAEFLLAGIQFLIDTGIHPWKIQDLKRRAQAFPSLIEQQLCAKPGSFKFLQNLV